MKKVFTERVHLGSSLWQSRDLATADVYPRQVFHKGGPEQGTLAEQLPSFLSDSDTNAAAP